MAPVLSSTELLQRAPSFGRMSTPSSPVADLGLRQSGACPRDPALLPRPPTSPATQTSCHGGNVVLRRCGGRDGHTCHTCALSPRKRCSRAGVVPRLLRGGTQFRSFSLP